MKITPTNIPDVLLVEPTVYSDSRGRFFEAYHQEKFREAGVTETFVQDNESYSVQGTLRGLHYQLSHKAQGKLIRVLEGEVFDVCVDIRKGSATYGQWVGEILSQDNNKMLYVPAGFAHGFYVVSDFARVLYKCTTLYDPPSERSILWSDPEIGINWPILSGTKPLLSEKDAGAPSLTNSQPG